jgi:hypothetical protein
MANKKLHAGVNLDQLVNFAKLELQNLSDDLILRTQRGYQAFKAYDITCENHVYTVYKHGDQQAQFGSTKSALAYCIADKNRNFNLAREIQQLDQQLVNYDKSIQPRQNLEQRSKGQRAEILKSKIQHRKQQRYIVKRELEKCVNLAKYLQLRGFQNDTQ